MPCPCPPRPQHGGSGAHVNPPLPSTLLRTGAAPYTHGSRPICRAEHPQFNTCSHSPLNPSTAHSIPRAICRRRDWNWNRRQRHMSASARTGTRMHQPNHPFGLDRHRRARQPPVQRAEKISTEMHAPVRARARHTHGEPAPGAGGRSVVGRAPWALPQRTPAAGRPAARGRSSTCTSRDLSAAAVNVNLPSYPQVGVADADAPYA